jgi:HAE1 family hydrophobic/amphiphilic exporter-1
MGFPISAWAVRRPVAPLAIFLLLTVLGVLAWTRLPVQAMPTIVVPFISVTVTQAGAAPEDLERQVTRRIEAGLAGITGVKHISSTCSPGVSSTFIEFTLETPVDRAVSDVEQAVSQVRSSLPAGVMEPQVQRIDVEGGAIRTYVVGGIGRSDEELSWFVDDVVIRRLQGLSGVAQVKREGGIAREIQVRLDPAKLAARGLSAATVDDQLRADWADLPGGRFDGGGERAIRVLGTEGGVAALRTRRISLPDGRSVSVGEIAEVVDGSAEPTVLARLDGRPVVAFGVYRAKGASEVRVAEKIDAELAAINTAYPGMRIDLVVDRVQYTDDSFVSAISAMCEGAVLAVLVVWLFLREWRATLITALAIPLSVIPTFAAMQAVGFTLNGVSLLALSLVAGILVDDAIVEIENIVRHQRMGMSPYRAAIIAADRIGLAVVATTMTIVAVFVPVSFMGGIPGKYFIEFGLTVAFAVLASLAVARLLTPLMAGYLLANHPAREDRPGRFSAWYQRVLAATIDHPIRSLVFAALLLVGSFSLVPLLPSGFIAAGDHGLASAQVDLPPGTPLDRAAATVEELSRRLRARPEVESVFSSIAVPQSNLVVRLVPAHRRTLNQQEFQRAMQGELAAVPDQRFGFLGENGQKELQVMLTGDDGESLSAAAHTLATEMRGMTQIANVSTAAELPRAEIRLIPKPDATAQLGVSVARIAQLARIATIGNDDTVLPKVELEGRQVPIRVQVDPRWRADPDILAGMRVPTASGGSVPLAAVVDIRPAISPGTVERFDRTRRVSIAADLAGATLGDALTAVKALPVLQNLPPGVHLVESGDAEIMAELFNGFIIAMALGVLLVYLVLVLLYRDLLHPLTIIAALPLSAGGAFLALLLANLALDMSALIGLLMLMGIVCKNAILLVDAVLAGLHEGMDRRAALLHAGATRARPIIMTTLAMVGGMLPIAFGFGPDAAFRRPMAIGVIGGLLASTALSLILVPVVFIAVDGLRHRLLRIGSRLVTLPSTEERAEE